MKPWMFLGKLLRIHLPDTTFTIQPILRSQPELVVENTVNPFEHKLQALNPVVTKTAMPRSVPGRGSRNDYRVKSIEDTRGQVGQHICRHT
ncbi:hypothetical protein Holit_01891 [Hollandina sp. SP2]